MHQAGELKVKVLPGRTKPEELESLLHDWLEKNPGITVVDIKYGYAAIGQRPACPYFSAMIIYIRQ